MQPNRPTTSEIVTAAISELAGVHASLALIMEQQQPTTPRRLFDLGIRLERAAKILMAPLERKKQP
jgi:hypothetical protein